MTEMNVVDAAETRIREGEGEEATTEVDENPRRRKGQITDGFSRMYVPH